MLLSVWLGKLILFIAKAFRLGSGGTWPGHIVNIINPKFLSRSLNSIPESVILISGTNGKTTTTALISHVLKKEGKIVLTNSSGANLINGLTSALLQSCSWSAKLNVDIAVLEIDENYLSLILKDVNPRQLILLNIFRDQLDRYGEVDTIRILWRDLLSSLKKTQILLNADDPGIASLVVPGEENIYYFGLEVHDGVVLTHRQISDSSYCPHCGHRLSYSHTFFSHLGKWHCDSCHFASPSISHTPPVLSEHLPGLYNAYNLAAAFLSTTLLGIEEEKVTKDLISFPPVFGRMEKISWQGRIFHLFLAKNPTGFNEALRTVNFLDQEKKLILIVLNDNVPDGRDISWIWDVDFEVLLQNWQKLIVSGSRFTDMGLRLKYALGNPSSLVIKRSLSLSLEEAVKMSGEGETIPVLATYSAMLQVRKILTGRSIL